MIIIFDENNKQINIELLEKPEQELAQKYVKKNDVVLELGARYGSVSCTINSILDNKRNQVSVEPDKGVWSALEKNREQNNCAFHILKGAIGKKKYKLNIDGYGSYIEVTNDDTDLKVYTLDEVVHLYKLNFNVLVADCEGCFENFIDENKEFFKNLRLVIFEADRSDICNYNKIRQFLTETEFVEIETRPHGSDPNFQNVWEKVETYIGIL